METQMNALRQVERLSEKYECPIIVVGDVFDTAATDISFSLLTAVQQWAAGLKNELVLIAGNHDLQYHDIANINKSGVGILRNSFNILPGIAMRDLFGEDITAYDFGEEKRTDSFSENDNPPDAEIVFLHRLTFPDVKSLPPNVKACTAPDLLKEFEDANWIFTGDYHKCFHYEKKGRHVINPGCLIRQSANEKDYTPIVYFVDTEKNQVHPFEIEDDEELVTDEYLREVEQRESRIDAFVELLKTKGSMTLDFIKNVEARLRENRDVYDEETMEKIISDETVKCIRELIYEE